MGASFNGVLIDDIGEEAPHRKQVPHEPSGTARASSLADRGRECFEWRNTNGLLEGWLSHSKAQKSRSALQAFPTLSSITSLLSQARVRSIRGSHWLHAAHPATGDAFTLIE